MNAAVAHRSRPAIEVRSERVRRSIASGDVAIARRLLGRPFAVRGIVVMGNQLGRTIGVPTANLAPCLGSPIPACGVYAAAVRLPDGPAWPAAANVGVRPTVGDDGALRVEAHLIGFEGDLYGQEIEVAFHTWIRGERRFDSLRDLKVQLAVDIREASTLVVSAGRVQTPALPGTR
jgi:riboflavin kinase/FMN adenylyltransferase